VPRWRIPARQSGGDGDGNADSAKPLDPGQYPVQDAVPFFPKAAAISVVSLTSLRQNIAAYFDQVTDDREPLVVTRSGGKGNLVVMSEAEFAGWQETVHLLSIPKNAERIMASVRQIKAGGARERKLIAPNKASVTA